MNIDLSRISKPLDISNSQFDIPTIKTYKKSNLRKRAERMSEKLSRKSTSKKVSSPLKTVKEQDEDAESDDHPKLNVVEAFFDGPFLLFVKRFRFLIILAGLALSAYSTYRCTEIQGLTKMEQYFKYEHQVWQAFETIAFDYNDGDYSQTIDVDLMWGIEGINKTQVDFFNASDIGSTIWDKDFDMSHPQAQK